MIKELFFRLSAPTPKFFKRLQKIFVAFGIFCGSFSAYLLNINSNSRLGLLLGSIATIVGFFATFIAQLPIDNDKMDSNG